MKCTDNKVGIDLVLIETLWNVKNGITVSLSEGNFVLIETLWNVKNE